MRARILVLLIVFLVGCDNASESDLSIVRSTLSISFQDEFEDDILDTSKWNTISFSPSPFDKILFRNNCNYANAAILSDSNITLSNGELHLIARREKKTYEGLVDAEDGVISGCNLTGGEKFKFDQEYTSASIFSKIGYDHGLFECRARIPSTRGLYPVFWLWHHDEIVVFEFFGNSHHHFVSAHNKEKYVTKEFTGIDYSKEFHTYAVFWDNEKITWFFDEKAIWSICRREQLNDKICLNSSESDNADYNIEESFPDSINRWLRPNFSLRIYEWSNDVDKTNFPDTLTIDYVRVYQNKSVN